MQCQRLTPSSSSPGQPEDFASRYTRARGESLLECLREEQLVFISSTREGTVLSGSRWDLQDSGRPCVRSLTSWPSAVHTMPVSNGRPLVADTISSLMSTFVQQYLESLSCSQAVFFFFSENDHSFHALDLGALGHHSLEIQIASKPCPTLGVAMGGG